MRNRTLPRRLPTVCLALSLLLPLYRPLHADKTDKVDEANRADPPATQPAADQAALEKEFARNLSGATLVGYFTTDGNEDKPKQEKYTLVKVSKATGDKWEFRARIQFGKRDVTLPLQIPVKWAGDTPVISVTNFGFPGLGTYTARVMIYADHYAGTWSARDHGGHLWGRVEHAPTSQPAQREATRGEGKRPADSDSPAPKE